VKLLSFKIATACADEITLPRSGRVGRGSGRGGSFSQLRVDESGHPYRPSPALRGRLSRRESEP
jgi:hypothetical protein